MQEKSLAGKESYKINPRSLDNLNPVKKGECRNPKGKNQYTWLKDTGIEVLQEMVDNGTGDKKQCLKIIIEKLRDEFLITGNVAAAKELLDRVFGKPHQTIDVTSNDEKLENTTYNFNAIDPEELRKIKNTLKSARKTPGE